MKPMITTGSVDADHTESRPRSLQDIVGTRTLIAEEGTGLVIESLKKQMLMITVEDNGIGIPDDKYTQLFLPFAQAQRMAGGTGLGLYSLAKRMKALGGKCGLSGRSDGGQGSLF